MSTSFSSSYTPPSKTSFKLTWGCTRYTVPVQTQSLFKFSSYRNSVRDSWHHISFYEIFSSKDNECEITENCPLCKSCTYFDYWPLMEHWEPMIISFTGISSATYIVKVVNNFNTWLKHCNACEVCPLSLSDCCVIYSHIMISVSQFFTDFCQCQNSTKSIYHYHWNSRKHYLILIFFRGFLFLGCIWNNNVL